MSEISNRILRLITEKGLSYSDLSKHTGIPKSALQRYATGETPKIPLDRLELIASALGVSAAYLMGWEDRRSSRESTINDIISKHPQLFRHEMRKVPILGKTACGEPIYSPNFDDGYALLNSDVAADFALEAKGDSMTGIGINSGDIIFFVEQDIVDNGQLAAVFVGEEVTLKRVYYYPDKNKLVLNSENPEFEPLVYIGEELEGIRIIGRAVAQLKRIK